MSSLAEILRAQFDMEEAAVFGKPATANKDRLVEISADGVLADSDEEAPDVGEEDSEEDEGGESENESETATDMREVWNEDCAEVCEVDYNPANDTCHNDDDDENADEPDEADEYPFIDLDGGLAAIAESDGGGGEESELEEECEFDYVGLASPQVPCQSPCAYPGLVRHTNTGATSAHVRRTASVQSPAQTQAKTAKTKSPSANLWGVMQEMLRRGKQYTKKITMQVILVVHQTKRR